MLFLFLFVFFFFWLFFFGCSKHKSLGIKPHIAHSSIKTAGYRTSTNRIVIRVKLSIDRSNSQEGCCYQHIQVHICRTSYHSTSSCLRFTLRRDAVHVWIDTGVCGLGVFIQRTVEVQVRAFP